MNASKSSGSNSKEKDTVKVAIAPSQEANEIPPSQMSQSHSPQRGLWMGILKVFVGFVCLIYIFGSIVSTWSTHNFLYILIAVCAAFIGLLQVGFIHDWFVKDVPVILEKHGGKIIKITKQRAGKIWGLRTVLLVLVLLGLVINNNTPFPSWVHDNLYIPFCFRSPIHLCGDGISVISLPVKENKDNQIKIGILDNKNEDQGPFNQYDDHNNGIEKELENKIFTQNQQCHKQRSGTLIIATSLSQTVDDTELSSNIGLDTLRGAYMAQYNFNQDQSQSFCLHLLIANFGTKGVVNTTVRIVMQQIKLYADSYPQDFMGVVGFTFSASVTPALSARSSIPSGYTIPIISSAAVADSFTDPSNTSDNFYVNAYRTVAPASASSKAFADFLQNHLPQTPTQTLLFEDKKEPYSQSLGSQVYNVLGKRTVDYTEGKPDSLNKGVNEILQNHYSQIFFSGFSDDLNALKNKLKIAQDNSQLSWDIRIVGGGALYDLGPYTNGNYANLVFIINASYAQINPDFSLGNIQVSPNKNCGSQNTTSLDFKEEFCRLFNQDDAPNIYGYKLPGTNVLQMYDAMETFLQALSQVNVTDTSALSQTINKNLPSVQFPGVTGKIQFLHPEDKTSIVTASDKPVFIACTDSSGYTHPVGEYSFTGGYSSPTYHQSPGDGLNACSIKS